MMLGVNLIFDCVWVDEGSQRFDRRELISVRKTGENINGRGCFLKYKNK